MFKKVLTLLATSIFIFFCGVVMPMTVYFEGRSGRIVYSKIYNNSMINSVEASQFTNIRDIHDLTARFELVQLPSDATDQIGIVNLWWLPK